MKKRKSRPVVPVTIWTAEGLTAKARALFDSGSECCIVRESALPPGANISRFRKPRELCTAGPEPLTTVGWIPLGVQIGKKNIYFFAHVASSFPRALVIGADAMNHWCVSIINRVDGQTKSCWGWT